MSEPTGRINLPLTFLLIALLTLTACSDDTLILNQGSTSSARVHEILYYGDPTNNTDVNLTGGSNQYEMDFTY